MAIYIRFGIYDSNGLILVLTYLYRTKWPTFCKRYHQMNSLVWRLLYCDFHFTEIRSKWLNYQKPSIGSDWMARKQNPNQWWVQFTDTYIRRTASIYWWGHMRCTNKFYEHFYANGLEFALLISMWSWKLGPFHKRSWDDDWNLVNFYAVTYSNNLIIRFGLYNRWVSCQYQIYRLCCKDKNMRCCFKQMWFYTFRQNSWRWKKQDTVFTYVHTCLLIKSFLVLIKIRVG